MRTGDSVTLAGLPLTVAAVGGDAHFSHTPVVWTSLGTWQRTAPASAADGPTATVIALRTTSGVPFAAVDERLGTATVSVEDSLAAIGSYASENGSLQLMRGFLFAISALVVGAFFTVWTIQRSADVAVLKALGASTRGLLGDALGQAVVLLAGGTLAGTGLAAAVGPSSPTAPCRSSSPPAPSWPGRRDDRARRARAALSVRRITSVDPLTALGSAR